jgi:hypothetical protein
MGVLPMLIHTAKGKRNIDEDVVVCIDRHRGERALYRYLVGPRYRWGY